MPAMCGHVEKCHSLAEEQAEEDARSDSDEDLLCEAHLHQPLPKPLPLRGQLIASGEVETHFTPLPNAKVESNHVHSGN